MTDTLPPPPAPEAGPAAPGPRPLERLNLPYHVLIGIAMGVVAIFTAFAWVPAVLTGIVIGRAGVEQRQGIRARGAMQALRVLAVTGGVLAMLFLGAIIGGLIAFLIVALAAFNERVAENTSPTDQTMARIIIGLLTVVVWFAAIYVIGLNLNIRLGS